MGREENSRFSWLARNLAGYIAGGYMLDKGSKNPAAEQAKKLAFDDVEALLLGTELERPVTSPQGGGPVQDIDPDEAIARALEKNGNGSFERFAGMVGALDVRGKMI